MAVIDPGESARMEPGTMTAQTACPLGSTSGHWLRSALDTAALVSGEPPPCPHSAPARWSFFPGTDPGTSGVDASRLRAARDFTITTLQRWGVAERCGDVAVVVSELLTNALRHAPPGSGSSRAGWPIRLGLLQPGQWIVCAVTDASKAPPIPRQPECFGETGRGLHVIAALSDQWGYTTPSDMGKVLWAVFSTRLVPCAPGPWPSPLESEPRLGAENAGPRAAGSHQQSHWDGTPPVAHE